MGTRTNEAAQRVVDQRRRVSAMLDELDDRLHEDIRAVRSNVETRASDLTDRAAHLYQRVPGSEALEGQVVTHPLTAVLGGFGTGVALGLATGGGAAEGEHRQDSAKVSGGTSRAFDILASAAMSSVAGPLRDEVQGLVRNVVSGFLGKDGPPSAVQESRA